MPRRLPLPGAEEREGRSIHYAVADGGFPRADLLIAGGGDSALDWTLNLHPLGQPPRASSTAATTSPAPDLKRMRELVAAGDMALHIGQISELHGTRPSSRRDDQEPKGEALVPCDILLAFYGLKMELGPIAEWGLNLDKNLVESIPPPSRPISPGCLRSATSSPIRAS